MDGSLIETCTVKGSLNTLPLCVDEHSSLSLILQSHCATQTRPFFPFFCIFITTVGKQVLIMAKEKEENEEKRVHLK